MDCPQTTTILKLAAGELPEDQEREVRTHVHMCEACGCALAELMGGWNTLDDWQVDVSGIDLVDGVLEAVDRSDAPPALTIPWHTRWRRPLQAAASIVLATGLGTGAGHLVTREQPAVAASQQEPVDGMTVALEWLEGASESATGLASGLPILGYQPEGQTP